MKIKNELRRRSYRYLYKIFVFLMIFLTVFILPFTLAVQRKAESQMSNIIRKANKQVLQQIHHDYEYYKEYISALCLTVYSRNDVMALMYNHELSYMDVHATMRSLDTNIVNAQPSVLSISVYNCKKKEWYSTEKRGVDYYNEDGAFLAETEELSRLTPIFRKIKVSEQPEAYSYVFSYLMYEYENPGKDSSLVIINQNADWLIEALTQVSKNNGEAKAYLAGKDGTFFSHEDMGEAKEVDLLNECMEKIRNGELQNSYGDYLARDESSLVSYLCVNDYGDVLILLQDYEKVFKDITDIRKVFLLFTVICIFLGLFIICFFSKILYKPVDELIKFTEEMKELPELQKKKHGSEFQRVQEILEYSAKKNEILQQQKVANDDILRRLLLGKLLCDHDGSIWKEYKKVLPNTAFAIQEFWDITVVIVKLNEFDNNRYDFKTSDEELLLYSVGNVCMEMLGTEYLVENTRQNEMETIFVLNRKSQEGGQNSLLKILEEVKEFCSENLDIELSIAISENSNDISKLAGLYKDAQDCLKYRMIYGSENILTTKLCAENMKNNAMSCSSESKKRLLDALRIRKTDKIENELDNIGKEIAKLNCDYVLFAVTEVLTLIYTCINDMYDLSRKGKRIDFNKFSVMVLEEERLSDMLKSLKKIVSGAFYCKDEACSEEEPQFLNSVIEYIELNYTDINLSLQNIADFLSLSPRYLSKKFRQCTDISLNDYILNYRMKQAAILLTDTNLSIKKVAESVGIVNENYFYQLFKKQFGCTPREFKINGGKNQYV